MKNKQETSSGDQYTTFCAICGNVPVPYPFVDRHDDGETLTLTACADCHGVFTYPCVYCRKYIHVDSSDYSDECPACGEPIEPR